MYKLLHGATYLGDANARAFRDMRVLEQQQLTDDPSADGGLETRCASSTADHSTRPICSSVTGIRLRRTACRADCVHDNPQPLGHMSRAFSRSDARRRSSRHRHRPRAWGALVHAALQAPRAWGACRPAGATRQRPCRVHTGVRTWRSSQSERERARRRGVRNCKGQTGVKTMAQATATFGDKVTSMKLGPLLKKNAPWVHRLPCTIAEWNDTLEGL